MYNDKKVLVVIPARGGSKGIPRKNVRYLKGKPLIAYTIQTALHSEYIDKVIVSTDDEEIGRTAAKYRADVMERPLELAEDHVPLDPVIYNVVETLEQQEDYYDIVVTIQPTSPLLKAASLDEVIEKLINSSYDTILSVIDDRHLTWGKVNGEYVPNYIERKNRQYIEPNYKETGAILATKRSVMSSTNRIGSKVSLYEINEDESIDIDSQKDWWLAEKLLNRKKLLIRVAGNNKIGLGHVYRGLTLAMNIMEHEVIFLVDEEDQLAFDVLKQNNLQIKTFQGDPLETIRNISPDIIINDILDTKKEYVQQLNELGLKVYNFEDLGDGAEYADGVFNALYPGHVPSDKFYTGELYYCARNEFLESKKKEIQPEVRKVLLTFGGTDPNNLTTKVLKAIGAEKEIEISVVLGPGYAHLDNLTKLIREENSSAKVYQSVDNMAELMQEADIIFSSAGRTMYEIAMVGTPAIIIAQNSRELTHLFGHNYNGFINLGLHSEVEQEKIAETFKRLVTDVSLRKMMNKRMKNHDLTKGLERVLKIIFEY